MPESSFPGKFLRKIDKIDTPQIEAFLSQVLREKAFLEVILDSITEGIVVAAEGMKIVFINETAKSLLALPRADCEGQPLHKVLAEEPLLEIAREFAEQQQPIHNREVLVQHPRKRLYAITVVPIDNKESLITHSVWIVSDRTDSWRRAKETQHRENIESLRTLTAGVAHEIKNPLNSLNIHAQLAQKAARDLEQRLDGDPAARRLEKSTTVIIEEIERLRRVVDDFIDAVRPVQPNLRRESLSAVIIAIAELVGPECRERRIDLTLDLDPEIPPIIIDPEQLHMALLNIVKNAIEAMDKTEGRIAIRTMLKTDHVLVIVEDNGCGIAEEDRMRIFEPYHSTKFGGTGLGLVMVYQIIKAHQGAIYLSSEVGEGTAFSLALPLDERPVRMLAAAVRPEHEQPAENDSDPDEPHQ